MEKPEVKDEEPTKTITQILIEVQDEICEKYCKYPDMYIGKSQGDEVDMLEDTMYTEICATCPFRKL